MRFRTVIPNYNSFAIDDDWYMREEIKRRNAEEKKRIMVNQIEKEQVVKRIAPSEKLINNFSPPKREIYKTFVREEKSIINQQKKLDFDWSRELKRQTIAFRGDHNRALDGMFDNGFAAQWNIRKLKLLERQKKNYTRMFRII